VAPPFLFFLENYLANKGVAWYQPPATVKDEFK